MVEVTRKNFEELLPDIIEKINAATFLAVDAEYTGIFSDELKSENTLFDSAASRYQKTRANVARYSVSQYGLAIFRKDRDANVYYVETFSFYLFPVAFETFGKRDLLTCQVSCLNFLSRNNFDFNKFIREGIPYLNQEKAENLRKYLRANRHILHTAEYLDEWYFPKKNFLLDDTSIEDIINRLAGFSKVIDAIHRASKPVIGHNFLTDLMLTHQMFWSNLPVSYDKFKTSIHNIFPLIYDTKYLAREVHNLRREINCEDCILSDSNLFSLYTNTYSIFETNMPIVDPIENTLKYKEAMLAGRRQNLESLGNSECHCAGFDALVTGCVFLNTSYLACRPQPVPEYRRGFPPTFSELLGKTECWNNRVNVARAVVSYINFAGSDPESHRPNWIEARRLDGHFIDPHTLKVDLLKYGDIEIQRTTATEVLIACGGIGCHRRVWQDLQKRGYYLIDRGITEEYFTKWKSTMTAVFGALTASLVVLLYKRLR